MNAILSSAWFKRLIRHLSNEPQDKTELLALLRNAQQQDVLTVDTLTMIEGALTMAEMHVRDIMIPRAQMVVLEFDDPPEKLVKQIVESGHSRFPVIGESRDDVQGILLAKDLLNYYVKDNNMPFNMRDVMRPAVFIPESKRLNVLLREFRTSRNHMAIVADEYNGVAGLITIEDVIEQVVGEIEDEYDVDEQIFIKPRGNNLYTVHALTPIEEFNEYFDVELSDEEFDTMGGLVIQALGHLPKRGETLELAGLHIEVSRANGRRVQLLRVKLL